VTGPTKENSLESTRRTFLLRSSGALGVLLFDLLTPELLAQAHRHAANSTATGSQTFRFLTPQEAADFDAFAAQVIPTDETPGAHQAGAVYFADYVLSAINPEQQQDFRNALAMLRMAASEAQPGVSSFAALPVERQIAAMKAMEKPPAADSANASNSIAAETGVGAKDAQAFGMLRMVALMGTFCDPSLHGNRLKIGWKLIGFDDQAYWAPPFGYYDANAEEKA